MPRKFHIVLSWVETVNKLGLWPNSGGLLVQDYLLVKVSEVVSDVRKKQKLLHVKKMSGENQKLA
ncbi:MAG: hypothetical protein R2883_03355 [Caldisericia bacterium]